MITLNEKIKNLLEADFGKIEFINSIQKITNTNDNDLCSILSIDMDTLSDMKFNQIINVYFNKDFINEKNKDNIFNEFERRMDLHSKENINEDVLLIDNALHEKEITNFGLYHDVAVVLDNFSINQLVNYYKNEFGEATLRGFIQEQITHNEITKEKNKKNDKEYEL